MKQYLRSVVSYQQENQSEWLPMAEFAANNAISDSTTVSLFFANYGFNLRLNWNHDNEPNHDENQDTTTFANTMEKLHDQLRAEMSRAQTIQANNANTKRTPAPAYQIGDAVLLAAKNIQTIKPTRKLDWKRFGRFRIKKVISLYAYELDLPTTMKVHPVFHVSLLDPNSDDPQPGLIPPPPPPVEGEGEEEFEVEVILDSRLHRKRLQYLVKWQGYDAPTWEPVNNLDVGNSQPVNRFHSMFLNKLRAQNYQVVGE